MQGWCPVVILMLLLFAVAQAAASRTTTTTTQTHNKNNTMLKSNNNNNNNNSHLKADSSNSCPRRLFWHKSTNDACPVTIQPLRGTIYILYDVNISEGFNLRRDVYIRMAVFVRRLRRKKRFRNVRLVLPPWPRLYHWYSYGLDQKNLMWANFFDLDSLRRYAPVLDYDEFLEEYGTFGMPAPPYVHVNQVFRLTHYEIMMEQGIFRDKYERITAESHGQQQQRLDACREDSMSGGTLLEQPLLRYDRYHCVRYQGSAGLLERMLREAIDDDTTGADDANDMRVYAILSAETVLHDNWGDEHFWLARRSMRFAQRLHQVAADFRLMSLSTTDSTAGVQRPVMWEMERSKRDARGGEYLCAHLRRGDFVQSRDVTTPTLKSAAHQIKHLMQAFNLTNVFIASDASPYELLELKSLFYRVRFFHFTPESHEQRYQLKDGGIAIIDQLICSYARHFIGTYESTFTYRIYEEREILGFSKASTFNTFCKVIGGNCARNAVWPIVWHDYDDEFY